jgi:hypothetical protein
MDFLSLCQRAVLESGISDTGPSSVSGQTSDLLRIVNWINDAWFELQASRNKWRWMIREGVIQVTEGNQAYVLPADVKNLVDHTICLNSLRLNEIDPPSHNCSSSAQLTRPAAFHVNYKNQIVLNAIPDTNYTLSFDYFAKPKMLDENISAPSMSDEYHMIVVWGALKEYAMYDEAPELYQKSDMNYKRILLRLENDTLPQFELAGPLA